MKVTNVSAFIAALTALLVSGPSGAQAATDVVCNGCVGSADVATNAVNSAKILDGTIQTGDLSANAVTTTDIKNNTVTYNKLSVGVRGSLDSAIAVLSTASFTSQAELFADAQCPDDRIPVAASCRCNQSIGTNNWGLLNECTISANGALGICLLDPVSFDPQLGDPIATVSAICLGAVSSDGTPWLPLATGLEPFDAKDPNAVQKLEEQARWREAQRTASEATIAEKKKFATEYVQRARQRLQSH